MLRAGSSLRPHAGSGDRGPTRLALRHAHVIAHLFTVDVEEYFQAAALESSVPRATWPGVPSRLEIGVEILLEALDRHSAKGTFFTLGMAAERCPAVVRMIADAGHELASHGWSHRNIGALGPQAFREEVWRTRCILEDLSGQRITGFRAPNFSLLPQHEWAFDALVETGYEYDSSLFPGRSGRRQETGYGPREIKRPAGQLLELPLACAHVAGIRIPAAGGAWFRLLPFHLTALALRQAQQRQRAAVFYIHPWELDADQPRLRVSPLTRLRHYGRLAGVEPRLHRLLTEFRFTAIRDWIALERVASAPNGARV